VAVSGQQGTQKTTLYVGSQTGLPKRAVFVSSGGHQATMDFYDYGAHIIIVPPTC
jgi:hypothetical protein